MSRARSEKRLGSQGTAATMLSSGSHNQYGNPISDTRGGLFIGMVAKQRPAPRVPQTRPTTMLIGLKYPSVIVSCLLHQQHHTHNTTNNRNAVPQTPGHA